MRTIVTIVFVSLTIATTPLAEPQASVVFEGGIGVQSLYTEFAQHPVVNQVRMADPYRFPWTIRSLTANVIRGQLKLRVLGLVIAGGEFIGTSPETSVIATLFCGPSNHFSAHSSSVATLTAGGELVINDVLSPPPPTNCTSPVLLIRVPSRNNEWIAAGIPVVK